MDLSQKQQIFSSNVSLLLCKIFGTPGYTLTLGEAFRTAEQAQIYAKEGKGIIDSLHCKRLALDINLFHNGIYLTKSEDYKLFGEYWKTLNPLNRWGGDFHDRPDGNHYQMNEF